MEKNDFLFTKDCDEELNAQFYCETLLASFYLSMSATKSVETIFFAEWSKRMFVNLITAYKLFNCFDENISEILESAWMIIEFCKGRVTEQSTAEFLATMQVNLYSYLHEKQKEISEK